MLSRTKKALLNRLENALQNMYHNATPGWFSLTENLWESYDGFFNEAAGFEIEYIAEGLGRCERDWEKQRKIGFTHNERYFYLVSQINTFGKLYTWGRGGRTLAPDSLIKQRGGSGFSIKGAENFSEYSNESLTHMVQVIEAFNHYVHQWNTKENLIKMWNEEASIRRDEYSSEAKTLRARLRRLTRDSKSLPSAPDSVCDVLKAEIKSLRNQHKELVKMASIYNHAII